MGNEQGRDLTEEEIRQRDIHKMDREISQKLGKGAQYNLRVVIKGDRNTGKSTLLSRLQGNKNFKESYIPTEEITPGFVNWNYKETDERVKVEVWDVVDKAKKNRKLYTKSGLKIKTDTNEEEEEDETDENAVPLPPVEKTSDGKYAFGRLDASLIDVYKGTNAVVIMMDPIKPWTFNYVKKEMKKIPQNIHTLLIVNFKDESSKRLVSEREIKEYVATIERDNFLFY